MTVKLFSRQGSELSRRAWPSWLEQEVKAIAGVGSVDDQMIVARRLCDDRIAILLTCSTPQPAEVTSDAIAAHEPIALIYSRHAAGRVTPTVHSDRIDFPRDLQHTNPVDTDEPVSFCLSRAGLQAVYDRLGVRGVLERLYQWFLDASIGQLSSDGWEPAPAASKHWISQLDVAWFQEHALNNPGPAWTAGFARTALWRQGADLRTFGVVRRTYDASSPIEKSALAARIDQCNDECRRDPKEEDHDDLDFGHVPWVFIWRDPAAQDSLQFSNRCATVRDLRSMLAARTLEQLFDDAVETCIGNGCHCANGKERKLIVVVVGVWRPQPLLASFGLSENEEARRLELRSYAIEWSSADTLFNDDSKVVEVAAYPSPSEKLLASVSNTGTPSKRVCVVGYGALGSAIADLLVRAGTTLCDVIDHDVVLAHNLARHSADQQDLLLPKAFAACRHNFGVGGKRVEWHWGDLAELPTETARAISERADLIIDATAEERVRRFLDGAGWGARVPVIRTEIFDDGRLGALFVSSGDQGTKLVDLYFALCWLAMKNDAVAGWLGRDVSITPDSMELRLGLSCSSPTVKMPKSTVVLHAAAMMPIIRSVLDGSMRASGVGINVASAAGHPLGWEWIDVPAFETLSSRDWDIRINPDVRATICEEIAKAGSDEAGGYLYGGWHLAEQRIVIVAASRRPPLTQASPTQLVLGPAGRTQYERRITERCRGRIHLVGSWHSHPQGSAELSDRDEATLTRFRTDNVRRGEPTLAVVAANGELRAHVRW